MKKRSGVQSFTVLILLLLVSTIASIVLLTWSGNPHRILTAIGVAAVMVVLCLVLWFLVVRHFRDGVVEAATQMDGEFQQYMDQWEYPYALFNSSLKVVWCNQAFRKLMQGSDLIGRSLQDMKIDWQGGKPDWDPIVQKVSFDGKYFRAQMSQIRLVEGRSDSDIQAEQDFEKLYGFSLRDVTNETVLEQENVDQQSVVGLFYVDNYDQIINDIDENERPILEASIFRMLSDLSSELHGVMNQLERDRYFLVFPRKYLASLEDSEFDILEKVKAIHQHGHYQVTLSIGVGVDKDIEKARAYAHKSVDLAMGRGGDQAVVTTSEAQSFYGGMTTTVESNNRVRTRLIAFALRERIEASDRVLIMGHSNPDLDCVGSALGMYRIAYEMKKPAKIVISREKHAAVEYLYNRIVQEKEYQSVIIDHDEAVSFLGRNTLLVVVDVNRKVISQYPDIIDQAQNIVVIDHHRTAGDAIEGTAFSYVEPFSSSASEMVTELMQYMYESPNLTTLEADGLFAGIALDTKNFTVKTGVRTFEAAAYLKRHGADSVRVRKMFKNDMEDYRAKSKIVGSATLYNNNIAIASWSSNLPNATTIAAQASDELLDIHGVVASFVLTELDEGQVNISARSLGELNVQLVMEQLGGGGHLSMAGAQLKDVDLDQARQRLVDAIDCVLVRKKAAQSALSQEEAVLKAAEETEENAQASLSPAEAVQREEGSDAMAASSAKAETTKAETTKAETAKAETAEDETEPEAPSEPGEETETDASTGRE